MESKTKTQEYDDCPICAVSRKVRSWVKCPECSFACCRGCVKTYLTKTSVSLTPECMSCHKQWDFEFVANNTHRDFHNRDYRNHRAKILLQRERSLLPGTQPLAVEELNRGKLTSEINELQEKTNTLMQMVRDNKRRILELKRRRDTHVWERKSQGEEKKIPKFRYIAHCPKNDCDGFVSNNWKCGLCNQKVCSKCHKGKMSKKDPEWVKHKCEKDDMETAQLLSKDTKPCPSCSIPIFKISGCDQMWCPECHTPFSWKTGKVETGVIHNPHYYQFQAEQNGGVAPRVRGDVRCGGVPDLWTISNHFRINNFNPMPAWILDARRIIDHIRNVELERYTEEFGEQTHLDLRVRFLIKDLSEARWFSELKRREKKREKSRAIGMVLRMFIDTLGDMFSNILECRTLPEFVGVIDQMNMLRNYANSNLKSVADRFNNKVPQISDTWEYQRVGGGRKRRPLR